MQIVTANDRIRAEDQKVRLHNAILQKDDDWQIALQRNRSTIDERIDAFRNLFFIGTNVVEYILKTVKLATNIHLYSC